MKQKIFLKTNTENEKVINAKTFVLFSIEKNLTVRSDSQKPEINSVSWVVVDIINAVYCPNVSLCGLALGVAE